VREVLVLQNAGCETLGTIAGALDAAGVAPRYVRAFGGEPVPQAMGDAAGLIVMGGPMAVYEHPRYPFLRDEMRLIEQALRADRPILGVCLGSQLIASVLGAAVTKGRNLHRIGEEVFLGWAGLSAGEAA
jgi:GMP synthase (glutamine-hydrolysing)